MADFVDSVTRVLLCQPFFGQLLMRYEHVADPSIPTACITRTSIRYNPEYFDKLTDDEGLAAVTHEVLHGAFMHLSDMAMYAATGIGPDGKPYDNMKYNRAADYVINDLIEVNKIGKLSPTWLHDGAYNYTMTPQEVYAMLPSEPPSNGQAGQDAHDPGAGDDPSKPDAVTPVDIVQAAAAAESLGRIPKGLERLIGSLRKPTHSPWAILRKAVQSAIGGNDAATWRRLQRRLITRRIGAPGRVAFGCNRVGVVVDTSGSIGDVMLRLFGGHMGAILTDARPKEIKVYWTDAAVHRVDSVANGGQLRTLMQKQVPGGGGTDMPKGVEAAVKDGCEAVVILTDGYTPFGNAQKCPVIWGIVGNDNAKAPHGTTVHLTE
jgi:predicted metal-dependent peptidase